MFKKSSSSRDEKKLKKAVKRAEDALRETEIKLRRFRNQIPRREEQKMEQEVSNLRNYMGSTAMIGLDIALLMHLTFLLNLYSYDYLYRMADDYYVENNYYTENYYNNNNNTEYIDHDDGYAYGNDDGYFGGDF